MESLAKRARKRIRFPSKLPVISCAASLAYHGLLGSVREIKLQDIDLTSVPADHLISLVSSVTVRVGIQNVSGCLVTILDSVKSKELCITRQSLDSEETRAVLRAMESQVEGLWLTQDIRGLIEYSGRGKCKKMECYGEVVARYRDQLMTWAKNRSWAVTFESFQYLKIERLLNFENTTV